MLNNRSESLNEIFSALAKAQSEIGVAGHTATNPHFKSKFADLTELTKVSRPALTKNGLSVIHQILPDASGDHYMHTLLCHASGQYVETRIRLSPDKSDIQSLGKYITYLKRYTYAALVGVVTSDEDDDGESLMQSARNGNGLPNKLSGGTEMVSKDQLEQLEWELKNHPDIVASIMDKMKINSLRDVPKSSFISVLSRAREIIATKENK